MLLLSHGQVDLLLPSERLLAAQNPLSEADRPHQIFADAPPTNPVPRPEYKTPQKTQERILQQESMKMTQPMMPPPLFGEPTGSIREHILYTVCWVYCTLCARCTVHCVLGVLYTIKYIHTDNVVTDVLLTHAHTHTHTHTHVLSLPLRCPSTSCNGEWLPTSSPSIHGYESAKRNEIR